jgi:hypothetical protein
MGSQTWKPASFPQQPQYTHQFQDQNQYFTQSPITRSSRTADELWYFPEPALQAETRISTGEYTEAGNFHGHGHPHQGQNWSERAQFDTQEQEGYTTQSPEASGADGRAHDQNEGASTDNGKGDASKLVRYEHSLQSSTNPEDEASEDETVEADLHTPAETASLQDDDQSASDQSSTQGHTLQDREQEGSGGEVCTWYTPHATPQGHIFKKRNSWRVRTAFGGA